MQTCEFCGSLIPDHARFCGHCGRVPSKAMETDIMASDFLMQEVQDIDTAMIANVSGNFQPDAAHNQQSNIGNIPIKLLSLEEEEEERRMRAALLGMEAPLLGSLAVEGIPNAGNVPTVEGTPQMGGVPTVQGTPYPPAGSMDQGMYSSPTAMSPQLPSSVAVSPLPATAVTLHHPHTPNPKPHEGSNQPVSAPITLCTSGTGTVNWTATWDQNAAPWLHLDNTSGQISAPGQAQVTVSALASNLAPGSYIVTLAFTSQPDNSTKSLQITFSVQGGCASGNPDTLSYSGVANVSDPAVQTVAITNCGPAGAWSAATQTNNGGNWLVASPANGTLSPGQTLPVQFKVPQSDCPIKGILSFTGPANTAKVEWSC